MFRPFKATDRIRFRIEYVPATGLFRLRNVGIDKVTLHTFDAAEAFEWLRLPGVECDAEASRLFDPPAERASA